MTRSDGGRLREDEVPEPGRSVTAPQSASTGQPLEPNPGGEVERRTLRKISRRLLPLIGACYIALYLDRLNISVAALSMNTELHISAAVFGLAAGIFFWSYTVLEVPSNYVLGRVGTRIWITRIMVTWGLVTIGTAFVGGAVSLSVARLLLGAAEAGFSPAMLFFAACWFPKRQRGYAMALMFSAICVSGVLTPLCTFILVGADGLAGLSGWRWLFALTGVPPLVLAVVWFRRMRDAPAQATFLDEQERAWLQRTLAAEADEHRSLRHPAEFRKGLANARVVVLTVAFLAFTFSLYGYQFFIPQIIRGFGLSTAAVGWVATLPPITAIGPMIWWARRSDRTQKRVRHFCIAALVGAAGFVVAAVFLSDPVVAMVGFCIAGIGLYSCMATLMAIPSTFLTGAALAAGLAFINGFGNFGGYLGPQVTGLLKDYSGGYTAAVATFAGLLVVAALVASTLRWSRFAPAVSVVPGATTG